MDDVTYVGDFEVWVECVICNIPGQIWYGSESFVLGSLHDEDVGFAGATLQFYSEAPVRFDYRFIDYYFVFYR
jgi:hypothetical protein